MIEIRHKNMDVTEDTQRAYNSIYRDEGILLTDSFYLWLIYLLRPEPGRLLVDISTGQGRLVTLAKRKGVRAVGVDFAIEGVRRGMQETPQAGWLVGDGEVLPLAARCADYVMHIGSLEHYQNPQAGISEIFRLLKPGGRACILLPNSFGLLGNIWNVLKTGDVFDDGQPLQRYNTRRGWESMLISAGLKPYCTLKYEREWPRTWLDLKWYLAHPIKFARLFVSWAVPLNFTSFLVYLCEPVTPNDR